MQTSEKGIALIKQFEGCKLTAYQDSVGVWTIGYGWTQPVDGKPIRSGMTIKQETAERLLKTGLVSYESDVSRLVKVGLTQGQFDALVSFTYNVGARSLSTSTLLRKLNAGDLNAKIQQKADDLVRKQEVRKQVRNESTLTERVLIEATAEVIATVRMEHRGDIRRARELTNMLFDELAGECGDVAALEMLGDLMRREDDKGQDKLNDLYHKIISLPSRVKSMKDLSDSLKTLIGLEREAYSIENKAETKEVTHNVMLVPTSDSVDDWEAAAQKQQGGVLGG